VQSILVSQGFTGLPEPDRICWHALHPELLKVVEQGRTNPVAEKDLVELFLTAEHMAVS
jgi:hypothetical protein